MARAAVDVRTWFESLARRPVVVAALVSVAVTVGSLALLNWWLGDHALVLSYVKVLVWPVALVTAVVWLQEPIRRKIGDIATATLGPGSVTFREQRSNETLTEDLKSPVSLLNPAPDLSIAPEEATPQGRAVLADDALKIEDQTATEAARREAIEKIIRDSAGWGWDMAGIGFKGRPTPNIEWTSDGSPRILYGESATVGHHWPNVSGRNQGEYARRLEQEIRTVEDEIQSPMRMTQFDRLTGKDKMQALRLADLKARLREADPNSPYAD